MDKIKLFEKLEQKIEEQRPRTTKLLKEFGDVEVDKVKIRQIIGGMRGIKSLVTDISYLDPYEGIRYRGLTLPEVFEKLPKPKGKEYPYVEGLFHLLLTGEIPTEEEVIELVELFKTKRQLPQYVIEVIRSMPINSHPMAIFAAAVVAMERESEFAKFYNEGYNKMEAWKYMLQDALNLLPKLPKIAAYIYRLKYKSDIHIFNDKSLDLGGNFANMMGIDPPFDDVARMYFIIHADHESGNASAHTGHLVASTLSDSYYAISAMLGALAGPLHGLANQEVLRWIQQVRNKMGNKVPTKEEMEQFVWDTLNSGQVIPGFGHAVLRKTDPRYSVLREFSLKHIKNCILFEYVKILYEVVPPILKQHGKAKNPWPNVDAHSGLVLWHYGITEFDFYTVLFGVGRAIGILSNIIWDRALGYPIERPKSLTTDMLEEIAGIKK